MSSTSIGYEKLHEEIIKEAIRLKGEKETIPTFELPIIYGDFLKIPDDEFLVELFKRILGRTATESEIKRARDIMDKHNKGRDVVIETVALSKEALSQNVEIYAVRAKELDIAPFLDLEGEVFIKKAYWWFLGRLPEEEAITDNIRRLSNGTTKEEILKNIAGSVECQNRGTALVGIEGAYEMTVDPPTTFDKVKKALVRIKRYLKRIVKR